MIDKTAVRPGPGQWNVNKKAQLSLTNPRDAKACQKLLQFDVLTNDCHWQFWSAFIRLAVIASEICKILWKFKLVQFKVIQGHRSWCQSKAHIMVTLDVFFLPFSRYWRISKIACFPTRLLFEAPSGGTPWDINVIYTPLKSAFDGVQFRRWHYRSIFNRLAVVASQNLEIRRNSDNIWPYSSSRSSKVIDLGVNRKLTCEFLLISH